MKRICFFLDSLSERGLQKSTLRFAWYNEKLLGNKSLIVYNQTSIENNQAAIDCFSSQIQLIACNSFSEVDQIITKYHCDALYIQKGGELDGKISRSCPTMVHAVFAQNPLEVHGHSYAFVSEFLSLKCSLGLIPAVPLIVKIDGDKTTQGLREKLFIPNDAIVYGCYGGKDSFDIQFVRNIVIPKILSCNSHIYFIFMNIKPFVAHKNVIFLPVSVDSHQKMLFVNTCDAMIHARLQGESFGLACAEFSAFNKPIFSYDRSPDKHQFHVLRNSIYGYHNAPQLIKMLESFPFTINASKTYTGYLDKYTPEYCMDLFDRHLLYPSTKNLAIRPGELNAYYTNSWRIAINYMIRRFIKLCIKLAFFIRINLLCIGK